MRPKLAVLIPAYNEASNLPTVLHEVHRFIDAHPKWQTLPIIVNDGSTDGTEALLSNLKRTHGVYAIHLPINLGIGRAVQTGLKHAAKWGADVAVQLDGDGQHPADQVSKLVTPILNGRCDVAVGSRYIQGAGGNVSSAARQLGTRFFSVLLKWIAGVEIADTTSGFRALNREAILYLSRFYPDDYPEVEAYVLLARKKFRIAEIPIRMRPRVRGKSSITPVRCVYYMIKVAFATIMGSLKPTESSLG